MTSDISVSGTSSLILAPFPAPEKLIALCISGSEAKNEQTFSLILASMELPVTVPTQTNKKFWQMINF